ncbi:tetratricopeptide repeat protein [Streptomyces zhihengii]|uniref:Tetratricopeptide repeat protein n=1 Tax=Streptomyces zhihengii TaxID=1818004 RepID=A0ABS2UMW8_9ACTN|nr:tetratricopeptide repeat protein [Streptomyces zhihengii]MBM9618842.1 tetratricopeptide repeat protein [Streptomyces zhihengii]
MAEPAAGLGAWRRALEEEGRAVYPGRIADAVAHPERYTDPDRFPRLAALVSGAVLVRGDLAPETTRELLGLAFDVVLTVGTSSRFREHEDFGRGVLALIDAVEEAGAPVSGLLLSAARFHALFANGDRFRRDLIVRAVAVSRDSDERVAALLTMSRSRTDVSDYEGARAALDECAGLMETPGGARWVAEYEHSLGLTYYYADPPRAAHHFERSVALGRDRAAADAAVRHAVASSLHFLGRHAAERGEHGRALRLYTEGEALSDGRLTAQGFFHQRVAEILVAHGTTREARYHLTRSQQTFEQAAQRSSALALLGGTWAEFYLRTGDGGRALRVVSDAVELSRREEGGARIELVLQAKRLRVLIRLRRPAAAAALLCRAARLYLRTEVERRPLPALRQTLVVARQAVRMLRPSSGTAAARPLDCPCGAAH